MSSCFGSSGDHAVQEGQLGLVGRSGWRGLVGIIDPLPEVAVGEEAPVQKGDEVGDAPVALAAPLEVLDQQDGQQCCPNLGFEGVFAGADEGLDLEVLLERLSATG